MSIDDFFVTPATILNPAYTTDRNGNQVEDWDNATSTVSAGWLQDLISRRPRSGGGAETTTSGDTVVSTHQWYCAPFDPISAFSRIVIGEFTFEVDGAPTTARTKEGPHHLEVQLHLVDDIHMGALS